MDDRHQPPYWWYYLLPFKLKSPSNIALLVTDYFLDVNTFYNSVGGLSIITTVNSAAASSGTVTDAEYDTYTQYTAWRFATWQQHYALTS